MSKTRKPQELPFGVTAEEAQQLGLETATRIGTIRLLLVLAQRLRNAIDHQLADDGLTSQQAAVLSVVKNLVAPTMTDIGRALGTSHQNVKQLASILVRKGFLRWQPDPEDARKKRLSTTSHNDRYWAARNQRDHAELLASLIDLDAKDNATLHELLQRMHQRLSVDGR